MDQTLIENEGGLMAVQVQVPSPSLQPFIATFALLQPQQTITTSASYATRILPDGSAHLIWYLYAKPGRDLYACMRFVGPRSVYKDIDRRYRAQTFLTTFRPGYAAPFLSEPIACMTDVGVRATEVWGGEADGLCEQLFRAKSLPEKVQVMERALLLHIDGDALVSRWLTAVSAAQGRRFQMQSVRALAADIGLSERHLRNVVRRHVGLRPKQWLRIERFRRALHAAVRERRAGWASLALEAGYYDQAHMIDEFHRLVGESPERFMRRWR